MLIKIGDVFIDPERVDAVYPSADTLGKVWFALHSGRTVWTMASMEEVEKNFKTCYMGRGCSLKVLHEIRELERLLHAGRAFIARDENGELYAYNGDPLKNTETNCWDAEAGDCEMVSRDLFDGVVEWQDSRATEISSLLDSMMSDPAGYDD